jgi:hypothetical protein
MAVEDGRRGDGLTRWVITSPWTSYFNEPSPFKKKSDRTWKSTGISSFSSSSLFLIVTLPGISWGAPGIWHPDEVVYFSIETLHTNVDSDTETSTIPKASEPLILLIQEGKSVFICVSVLFQIGSVDKQTSLDNMSLSLTYTESARHPSSHHFSSFFPAHNRTSHAVAV